VRFLKAIVVLILFGSLTLPSGVSADYSQQSKQEGELEELNKDSIGIEEEEQADDILETENILEELEEESTTDNLTEQEPEVDKLEEINGYFTILLD